MKVLLLNGSPHEKGCTYTALREVADTLEREGIETEILSIGNQAIHGCIDCRECSKSGTHRCIFKEDRVNEALDKMLACDGLVVGSPVHYASAGGSITSFLDRMFHAGGTQLRTKVGAAVVSARRAGTSSTLDQLQKYFIIRGMPIAPSQYWCMVHGSTPEDVRQDEEGMQTMRTLARYMAYMMKSFAFARENGLLPPAMEEPKKRTNFIR